MWRRIVWRRDSVEEGQCGRWGDSVEEEEG